MSYLEPYWFQKKPSRWLFVDCDPVLGCIDLAEIIVEKRNWKIIIRFNINNVSQRDRAYRNTVNLDNLFSPFEKLSDAKEAVEQHFAEILLTGQR